MKDYTPIFAKLPIRPLERNCCSWQIGGRRKEPEVFECSKKFERNPMESEISKSLHPAKRFRVGGLRRIHWASRAEGKPDPGLDRGTYSLQTRNLNLYSVGNGAGSASKITRIGTMEIECSKFW